ncbi:MAG: hypothetical protein QOE97_3242 [Pseudonocardiales bacterium]|jgi:hypothetical protein|nr:hypothetical protein [Pseudonocardiales bacterium]
MTVRHDETALEPAVTADDAWERAYKASVTTSPAEQAGWLLEHLGPRFTAAGVGVSDARTVRRWRDAGVAPRDHAEEGRLRLLFRIGQAIHLAYGDRVAASFLRSANPQLDDEAPLVVLAANDPDEAQKPVLAALRAFLEG